jgi:hypothetical protein
MAYHTTEPVEIVTEVVEPKHPARAPGHYYRTADRRYGSIPYPDTTKLAKAIAARFPNATVDGLGMPARFPEVFGSAADVKAAAEEAKRAAAVAVAASEDAKAKAE